MDGANDVISKPPPLMNGHAPHLEGSTDVENVSNLSISEPFAASNSLNFDGALNSHDTNLLNGIPLESDVSLKIGVTELPFPLPDIDTSLLDPDFSLVPTELDAGEGSGFSFDSSVFNDDLVNSAIWSIGGSSLPNLDTSDVPQQLELQSSEFDVVGVDGGINRVVPPEDNIGQMIPSYDASGQIVPPDDTSIPLDDTMPLDNTISGQTVPPSGDSRETLPPDGNDRVSSSFPPAPYVGVYCMVEEGFEDNFSCPNPFFDSSGVAIDPFLDLARNRALSTITEGFEEEDEDSRFERSGNFNPSSLNQVLNTFADAHDLVRSNSDANETQQWKATSRWVDFDVTVPATSDWSNQDVKNDSQAPSTELVGGENQDGLEETVGSPISDGNQVGVSPETVEVGLSKPMSNSWQPVSNEDDVITVGDFLASSQHESSTESSVIDSHVTSPTTTTSVNNFNPSNAQLPTSVEVSPSTERPVSPSGSDESGEYLKLSNFHSLPVSAAVPAAVLQSADRGEETIAVASSSVQSPNGEEVQVRGDASSSVNVPESVETTHSASTAKSDFHTESGMESGIEIGTTVVTATVAASAVSSVVNEGMRGTATGHSGLTSESKEHREDSQDAASCEQVAKNQQTFDVSSTAGSPAEQGSSENDQGTSSLDVEDRSRTFSNLDRGPRESNLDSSNLDAGLRRNKSPNSTPPSQRRSHPVTNLPVLTPLSPEHGRELNEQYEFLRRTLSHSQRRYSERRRQRGREGGKGPSTGSVRPRPRYANVTVSNDSEVRTKQTVGQLRELLRKSEAQPTNHHSPEGHSAHVDHHGRTYYMDHNTRTIDYSGEGREVGRDTEAGVPPSHRNPRDMQTRREMLNRRYQSLQRSFRRSNSNHPRRSPRSGLTTSTAASEIENQSLTLTRQEADDMMRSQTSSRSGGGRSLLGRGSRTSSSVNERSSNRKQRSSSGSKTRWLFGRKSNKSISQQGTSSGDDDFLPVFSPTIEGESRVPEASHTSGEEIPQESLSVPTTGSEGQRLTSQSSITSVESQSPLIPPSDSDSRDRVNNTAAVSASVAAAASSSDNERELTRSTGSAEREPVQQQGADVSASLRTEESPSDEQPLIIAVTGSSPRESVSAATTAEAEQQQNAQESSSRSGEGEGVEAVSDASPAVGEVGRQSTIVRASGLLSDDRDAAVRARQRVRTRSHVGENRHRRNTDEVTNEEAAELARRSRVVASTTEEQATSVAAATSSREGDRRSASSEPAVRLDKEEEAAAVPKAKSRSSRRSQKAANCGLYVSPGLRFITRKDLYSFLTSAGQAGDEFFANRALMELVQRIRADNSLFEKYQHSRHLVSTLNQFADVKADLPSGWEKKLNKEGKIFFIDHEHELTTFIDPRLPLPNQQFTYTPVQSTTTATQRVSYDEPGLRPHHTTTVRHSQSMDSEVAFISPPSSTQGNSLAPPSSSTSSSPSRASLTSESSVGGVNETTSTRTSSVSEAVDPPSYEEQVVAFFRQADIVAIISGRYHRGVRPQLRDIIAAIRMEGTTALERIQMSGSIATYELAIVLSLFEEDISRMNPRTINSQPIPLTVVSPPPTTSPTPPTPSTPSTPGSPGKGANVAALSTLQRRKLDFATKLQNFKIMMTRVGFSQGSRLKFNIRRDHLLEDAYEHTMKSNLKHLQMKRLNISFKGEEGLDYGGPSREFFFLLSREIFNPYYGLFEYSANDTYTVQISPTSSFIHNNLEWFRFAGRIVGLVIAQGFLLDVFFTRTVYKSLLCKAPHLKDLEALEPAFYNSLLWIQENDPEPLDLTFTVEEEAFGQVNSHELKPGGADILVTEENKDEYIDLMLRWRLDRGVAKQMESFKKGFCEVMPVNLLYNFDAQELEFLTAGTLEIDVDDWRAHTEYRNGYHPAHQVVLWFWQAVETFDNEQRLRLLQFVTGTSSVPFEGFKALRGSNGPKRFCIDFFNDVNAFPRTHTCFNRIDLPPYPSFEALYEKLRFAVEEGGGFGIE